MKLLAVLFLIHTALYAQDERFFRGIFTDELQNKPASPITKVQVSSPEYAVDLNRDGVAERISVEKRDGADYFLVKDRFGDTKLEARLFAKGVNSKLFKVHLKTLSTGVDALILHFDEGSSGTAVFQSTARLYLVTIEDRNLEKMYLQKGPAFYYEKEILDLLYARRYYNVNVMDFNNDGIREVAVAYNNIQRIYFYLGKGRWKRI